VQVDVALVPELMGVVNPRSVYLVVDVIRATTTLSVFFERSCRRVLVAPDIPRARAARERLAREHPGAPPPLLAGEAGGVAPAGFDLGNSPTEAGARELARREIVFATTNGTRALRACVGGGALFAGALRNAWAVAGAALEAREELMAQADGERDAARSVAGDLARAPEAPSETASEAAIGEEAQAEIVIVCSGRERRPAYDDTLCAGVLARELARQVAAAGAAVSYTEGARIALALAERTVALGGGTWEALRDELARTDAATAIARVGLGGDLAWCAAVDAATVAPRVVGVEADGLLVVEAG
jgi:2-phosphosulfolactate phosphatase